MWLLEIELYPEGWRETEGSLNAFLALLGSSLDVVDVEGKHVGGGPRFLLLIHVLTVASSRPALSAKCFIRSPTFFTDTEFKPALYSFSSSSNWTSENFRAAILQQISKISYRSCQSSSHDLSQMNRLIMLKQQLRSGYSTINLICPITSCANNVFTWAYSRLIIWSKWKSND